MPVVGQINMSNWFNVEFRKYWDEQNRTRNAIIPKEQLVEINRRIIYAAMKIGLNKNVETKISDLTGETLKYHISSIDGVADSIKNMGVPYKYQKAVQILHGVGNFGSTYGSKGAAARYISVQGTPLLEALIADIPYVPMEIDETGKKQPKWLSSILPFALIGGVHNIGMGKSTKLAERDALEVINWIDELQNNPNAKAPAPISSSKGCAVWEEGGLVWYKGSMFRQGYYDIIDALPPQVAPFTVIQKLRALFPKHADRIEDISGDGTPVQIRIPKNLIKDEDWTKIGIYKGFREAPYIWDVEANSMRLSTIQDIALEWFESRKKIVTARLKDGIENDKNQIKRINLVKLYVENEMNTWKSEDIVKELGEEDASIVLSMPARTFLPENIAKNEKVKKARQANINKILDDIKNIGEYVLEESRQIIKEQEEFFETAY